MRLSILQENLSEGLSIVGRAILPHSMLSILSNILLSTDEDQLKLTATNLEISVSCWLDAQIKDNGSITLPAYLLTNLINLMPSEQINLEMITDMTSMNFKCARFESNIKGIDANEFPLIPTADGKKTLELPTATLRKIINQVIFAAADAKDARTPLTGVSMQFKDTYLILAAADGYRLSVSRIPLTVVIPEDLQATTIIVPARSLAEVNRISGKADPNEPVELAVAIARNQILFRLVGKSENKHGMLHRINLVSSLIDGKFPDFNTIMPKDFTTRSVLDTATFLRSLKVASLFARDTFDRVVLQITPGNGIMSGLLTLRATSAETGDSISKIDADVKGDALEIAFNIRYLIDALSVIDTPQVVLETSRPDRPGVFRPVDAEPKEFIHVIMPMQLNR